MSKLISEKQSYLSFTLVTDWSWVRACIQNRLLANGSSSPGTISCLYFLEERCGLLSPLPPPPTSAPPWGKRKGHLCIFASLGMNSSHVPTSERVNRGPLPPHLGLINLFLGSCPLREAGLGFAASWHVGLHCEGVGVASSPEAAWKRIPLPDPLCLQPCSFKGTGMTAERSYRASSGLGETPSKSMVRASSV